MFSSSCIQTERTTGTNSHFTCPDVGDGCCFWSAKLVQLPNRIGGSLINSLLSVLTAYAGHITPREKISSTTRGLSNPHESAHHRNIRSSHSAKAGGGIIRQLIFTKIAGHEWPGEAYLKQFYLLELYVIIKISVREMMLKKQFWRISHGTHVRDTRALDPTICLYLH